VWDGERPNAAVGLLMALDIAAAVADLSRSESVDPHKLKGDGKNHWATTVNDCWQICFRVSQGRRL
jgi:plasmid maintenance system killer protein